jgi:hypothetical protein
VHMSSALVVFNCIFNHGSVEHPSHQVLEAEIYMNRADNPHDFSRPDHNLRFTENKIYLNVFTFFYLDK